MIDTDAPDVYPVYDTGLWYVFCAECNCDVASTTDEDDAYETAVDHAEQHVEVN